MRVRAYLASPGGWPEKPGARHAFRLRYPEHGEISGPLKGLPVAIKDNFAEAGRGNSAGGVLLTERAAADSWAVARLKALGARIQGRTNMTELAYSGLGLNPHFGTPENALNPAWVPGGSSSGAASAVKSGAALVALGTDTGGSVRIPAAFQGLVGVKPTNGRFSTAGVVPLSPTLDTVGVIAEDVADAWVLFSALDAGDPFRELPSAPGPHRFFVPELPAAPEVKAAFEAALERIAAAGHLLVRDEAPELFEVDALYKAHGALAAHEAYRLWGGLAREAGARMDPRVRARILAAERYAEADYEVLLSAYERLPRAFWERYGAYDALLMPTVAVMPPSLARVAADEAAYLSANAAVLRNTMRLNFLKGPAISLPLAPGVGLMLGAPPGEDLRLFSLARALEAVLASGLDFRGDF